MYWWTYLLPRPARSLVRAIATWAEQYDSRGAEEVADEVYRWVVEGGSPYMDPPGRNSPIRSTMRQIDRLVEVREAISEVPSEFWGPWGPAAAVILEYTSRWVESRPRYRIRYTSALLLRLLGPERDSLPENLMGWFCSEMMLPCLALVDDSLMNAMSLARTPAVSGNIEVGMRDVTGKTWINVVGAGMSEEVLNSDFRVIHQPTTAESPLNAGSGLEYILLNLGDTLVEVWFELLYFTLRVAPIMSRRIGLIPFFSNLEHGSLRRYQLYTREEARQHSGGLEHCVLHTLHLAGVDEVGIHAAASLIQGEMISVTMLAAIARLIGIRIELTYATGNGRSRTIWLGDEGAGRVIRMGVVGNHAFLNEKCDISLKFLAEYNHLRPDERRFTNLAQADHHRPTHYYETPETWSFDVLNHMYNHPGFLSRPRFHEISPIWRKAFRPEDYAEDELNYPKGCVRPIQETSERFDDLDRPIWFADFEAFVNEVGTPHIPFLLCWGGMTGPISHLDCSDNPVTAIDEFLSATVGGVVYFHNLPYDGAFVLNYTSWKVTRLLERTRGHLLELVLLNSKGQQVWIRDSLAVIPFALREFPRMLGVESEKEPMPYTFYTPQNLHTHVSLRMLGESEEEIAMAADRAGALEGDMLDLWKYAVYYCKRDVEVLRDGFKVMDRLMIEAAGEPLVAHYSIPSHTFHYFRRNGAFTGAFELRATPAAFIRKCIVGGRCMLANNQKQDVEGPISDFDAVSLYPSAINLLHVLKGTPKPLTEDDLEFWDARQFRWDGYFVEIEILSVGKNRSFPLISHVDRAGVRQFENRTGRCFVDNIALADLIEFHAIEYRVIRGYYFNEGKNYRIRELIRGLFDLRREAKAKKQPIEMVYKLMMNSAYGKTILKPREQRLFVLSREELDRKIMGSPFQLCRYSPLQGEDRFLGEFRSDSLENWSLPQFGAQVLSMSKHLMSRVMCLAEDQGMPIYYTDTDSMHLRTADITPLAEFFYAKYGEPLIGKDFGQFHSDFPTTERGEMWSTRFIGLGKKAYLDLLTDGVEKHCFIRMKGIPEDCVTQTAVTQGKTVVELYEQLLDPTQKVTFDLAALRVRFARDSSLRVFTVPKFTRTVSFPGELNRTLEPVEELVGVEQAHGVELLDGFE